MPRTKIPLIAQASTPFNNPFAALSDELPAANPSQKDTPGPAPAAARPPYKAAKPRRPHVHQERKGRGGKTVTILGGLHLGEAELQALAQKLKKALGCGASVEGESIVLQGEQQERAIRYLAENTSA